MREYLERDPINMRMEEQSERKDVLDGNLELNIVIVSRDIHNDFISHPFYTSSHLFIPTSIIILTTSFTKGSITVNPPLPTAS